MMKDLMFHHQLQQQQQQEENMSNLTSASGEQASISSGNNTRQHFAPPSQAPPAKKKRNLPGNPDPDAEVVSLSPKTLVTTNRFVCEICNKGFQRDQNLQLHRRGHNLPWKLKQRTSKEVKKKVYVCPEPKCVHHDPSRALGDLTGIKKHYYRKHGEKKWKCDKCSKRYAVQSDWKAHSKTCGTREYRCDCGTIFSRRDSFITHRAFCDALAEESARVITGPNPLSSSGGPSSSSINLLFPHQQDHHQLQAHGFSSSSSLKKEHLQFQHQQQPSFSSTSTRAELPLWLAFPPSPPPHQPNIDLTSPISSSSRLGHHHHHQHHRDHLNPNPSISTTSLLPPYPSLAPPPHMSATALLQKAAQMGATISSNTAISTPAGLISPYHHQQHQEQPRGLSSVSLLQDMMNSFSSPHQAVGFDGTSFEDAFVSGVLKKDGSLSEPLSVSNQGMGGNSGNESGGSEGLTRDFLGLRPLSRSDILSMAAGLGNCINNNSSNDNTNQQQKPW